MGASYQSAGDLVAGFRTLELDPVQVAEAALEAAHTAQNSFNAISAFSDDCLRAAEASRERYRAGGDLGPLDGVPVTVKDSYRVAGLRRWHGSAVHDGVGVSAADSAPVRRLKEAGAILVAKTTMPDFGMLASGISSQFGIVRNPWGPQYTTGGSSAGAAVTLAAGVVPVAMGTDVAGSVRLPAAHCGAAAIKPTQGRIAYAPASMARSAGPMARRAADLEAMLECVGRADASDPWCLPGRFAAATWGADFVRGKHVGMLTAMGYGLPADGETLAVATKAAEQLASWGAEIEELRLDVTEDEYAALDLGFKLGALAEADGAPDHQGERLLGMVKDWCETARGTSGADAMAAANIVAAARDRVVACTERLDFVVAPVMPIPMFPADRFGPVSGVPPLYHASFTAWFNQTGQPAASICGGRTVDAVMPIGVQVVGKRFCDADVLRVAVLLEEALDVELPWPNLVGGEVPNV
jgi:aspartyl-tRNA(Asn)/glutamyl-tRNA(Gln) amidotransferase subunit A